ncbi:MAG: hypothetical protein AAF959_16875, partial [Cyanobacteria bacterium P01_D01_bin.56]
IPAIWYYYNSYYSTSSLLRTHDAYEFLKKSDLSLTTPMHADHREASVSIKSYVRRVMGTASNELYGCKVGRNISHSSDSFPPTTNSLFFHDQAICQRQTFQPTFIP